MTTPLPSSDDPLRAALVRAIGSQYEIFHLLGRGGMGAVYLGVERFLERQVAIKILPAEAARDPEMIERFRREARTAANLTHPNIVPLHTYGEAEGMPYFVMGFVRGEGLSGRLARHGRLDPEEVRRILAEVADALDYAHRRGVVHRDVKPDNILIEEESGRALLADFGVARQRAGSSTLTTAGTIVGTPYYMSPEQATADRTLDGRSDLYSLGIVGYELLTGKRPFDGDSVQGILTQHLLNTPAPIVQAAPGTPQLLVQAIDLCLAKDPDQRWADAGALRAALTRPSEPEFAAQMPPGAERLPAVGWGAGAVAVICLAFLFGSTISPDPEWQRLPSALKAILWGSAALLPALLLIDPALRARRAGWDWSRVWHTAFLEPGWWGSWFPRALRRPDSVWARLPAKLRRARACVAWSLGSLGLFFAGGLALAALTALTVSIATYHRLQWVVLAMAVTMFISLLGALGAAVAGVWMVHAYARNAGVADHDVLRLFSVSNTHAFWRRPHIARLLLPPDGQIPAGREPQSSGELAARIQGLAAELRDQPLAGEAITAARRLLAAIEAAARELALLDRDLDPAQAAQIDRQLAALHGGEGSASRRQMRELLEGQQRLLKQLAGQREFVGRRKERLEGLLRTLWLQLASLRADAARERLDAGAVTGRVREICREISAQVAAGEEVRGALGDGPTLA